MRLRCATYLAAEDGEPGLPRALFAGIAARIGDILGVEVSLEVARCGSGPRSEADDPFARDTLDLAWVCAPSMLWLHARGSVDLLPASMVLDDPRSDGQPTYFCEVVTRVDHPARGIEDLRGAVAACNDPASLSGFGSLLGRVGTLEFFGRWEQTGSHARSVDAVRSGAAEVAAIDANVWRGLDREGLRVLETLGPFPIQPIVVRRGWPQRQRVADALCAWRPEGAGPLRGFAPVTAEGIRGGVPWDAIQRAWGQC